MWPTGTNEAEIECINKNTDWHDPEWQHRHTQDTQHKETDKTHTHVRMLFLCRRCCSTVTTCLLLLWSPCIYSVSSLTVQSVVLCTLRLFPNTPHYYSIYRAWQHSKLSSALGSCFQTHYTRWGARKIPLCTRSVHHTVQLASPPVIVALFMTSVVGTGLICSVYFFEKVNSKSPQTVNNLYRQFTWPIWKQCQIALWWPSAIWRRCLRFFYPRYPLLPGFFSWGVHAQRPS